MNTDNEYGKEYKKATALLASSDALMLIALESDEDIIPHAKRVIKEIVKYDEASENEPIEEMWRNVAIAHYFEGADNWVCLTKKWNTGKKILKLIKPFLHHEDDIQKYNILYNKYSDNLTLFSKSSLGEHVHFIVILIIAFLLFWWLKN